MKRFKLKRRVILAVLAGTTVLAAGEAVAQSLFGNSSYGYGYGGRDLTLYLMMVRIATMGTSAALGFGIGWFLSPKARQFRKVAALVALAVGGAIAVFNHGALGWSLTTLLSAIGFFAALGYWLGTAVKALGEVPSTFGSAKWADTEEVKERGLFGKDGLRLGTFFNGEEDEAIAYKGDRHLLTVAPTRSGRNSGDVRAKPIQGRCKLWLPQRMAKTADPALPVLFSAVLPITHSGGLLRLSGLAHVA